MGWKWTVLTQQQVVPRTIHDSFWVGSTLWFAGTARMILQTCFHFNPTAPFFTEISEIKRHSHQLIKMKFIPSQSARELFQTRRSVAVTQAACRSRRSPRTSRTSGSRSGRALPKARLEAGRWRSSSPSLISSPGTSRPSPEWWARSSWPRSRAPWARTRRCGWRQARDHLELGASICSDVVDEPDDYDEVWKKVSNTWSIKCSKHCETFGILLKLVNRLIPLGSF